MEPIIHEKIVNDYYNEFYDKWRSKAVMYFEIYQLRKILISNGIKVTEENIYFLNSTEDKDFAIHVL